MNNINIRDFKQLKVWQKAIELSQDIYEICSTFPQFENYALKSQIIRACCSISANVAEGNGVGNLYPKKELSFLSIAIGSANEVRSWLVIALNNNYISQSEFDILDNKTVEIIKMLHGCVKRIMSNLNHSPELNYAE